MPFGFDRSTLVGLTRDVRAAEVTPEPIRVYGARALALAAALAQGGEVSLVCVGGDARDASALVCVVDGSLGADEVDPIRAATSLGVPVIAVRLDGGVAPVPRVLAMDVVAWAPGAAPPCAEVADRLAVRLGRQSRVFAARLPVVRPAVESRLVSRAAVRAGALSAAPWLGAAETPVLCQLQARLLLDLETAGGGAPPLAPRALVTALAPRVGVTSALGLASRSLSRRLPTRVRLAGKVVIAYGATRALGKLAPHLPFPG